MFRSISTRGMLLLVLLYVLCPANFFAQQSSDVTSPAPKTARPGEAVNEEHDQGVEQDDPTARLQWQRETFGPASPEFRRRAIREAQRYNLRMGKRGQGAEAGAQLPDLGVSSSFAATGALAPSAAGPQWISIGPTETQYEQNGSFTGLVADSGRARTILPHPSNPDIVYFLTSGGGLWKTTNFTSANTTWAPLTDNLPTTGGGAMSFGRTPDTIYLGLGDTFDTILVGGAMVKTTDGGNTWSSMIELDNAVSVRDVQVDTSGPQDIVLVATDVGMYRSTDSGATYTKVGASVGEFGTRVIWSIVRTSAGWLASAQLCTATGFGCGQAGSVYLSTDHGATWAPIPNTGNVLTGVGRVTLAVAQPGESTVYAYAASTTDTSSSAGFKDIFKSTDGGLNWVALNALSKTPTNAVTGVTSMTMNICHGQCYYNQMILVDPSDATRNTVYVGGDLASAKTSDGGNSWTFTSWWLYKQFPPIDYAHADFHSAAFKSTGTPSVLVGNDGGLFVSTDGGVTWSNKNKGLVTWLFYTITGNPFFPNFVMGGAQDNGTRARVDNSTLYNQVIGGDGLGAAYSQANTATVLGSAQGSSMRTNLTQQVPALFQNWLAATSGLTTSEAGFFTDITPAPAALDATGTVFFTFTNTRVYKSVNGGLSWTVIGRTGTTPGLPAGRSFRSTAYDLGVSPQDINRIAVGAGGGFLDITTNGGTSWVDLNLIALVPNYQGFISNVTWADNKTIWIASVSAAAGSVRVIKATIANEADSWTTATFTPLQSGLPDLPVTKLLIDPRDATNRTLYAATHVGVYRTTDGAASWQPYGTGLPNVRVNDMYMPPDGGFLRIASYGRGFWEIPQLEFVSANIVDDVKSCDHDGVLDEGETGRLVITLHNQSSAALNHVSASVTSSNPHVTFPNGNNVVFGTAAGNSDVVSEVQVKLSGAAGIETTTFTISFNDPDLGLASPVNVTSTKRLNYDEVAASSATDAVESSSTLWTITGTARNLPDVDTWQMRALTPTQHIWAGPDNNGQTSGSSGIPTEQSLVSPVVHVGAGPFSISFDTRFAFESGGWDGGVIEISTDGASWTDIGTSVYNGALNTSTNNPIGAGHVAFVNRSAGYPAFTTLTINLGTTYAGQDVRIRFRNGADDSTGAPGWDLDNITFTGITTTPFSAIQTNKGVCADSLSLASAPNPSQFLQEVTFSAVISGGLTDATGSVAFDDGGVSIGSAALSGNQAVLKTSSLSVGSHKITATYPGDATHAPASNFVTQAVGLADQTITFGAVSNKTVGDPPFTLNATASSGLPVSFAILSGPATVSGNLVTLTGQVGKVTVEASQPGNGNFNPAPNVDQSFEVSFATCLLYNPAQQHKAGSTIPIKLTLCSSQGKNLSSPFIRLRAVKLVNVATGAVVPVRGADDDDDHGRDGDHDRGKDGDRDRDDHDRDGDHDRDHDDHATFFRFDRDLARGGGYIFNLSTKGLSAGAWQLVITATGDNVPHNLPFQVR